MTKKKSVLYSSKLVKMPNAALPCQRSCMRHYQQISSWGIAVGLLIHVIIAFSDSQRFLGLATRHLHRFAKHLVSTA